MAVTLPFLGTRMDLEMFSKTSLGPLTFQVLDEQGAPWPVGVADEIRLWVKPSADATDVQAVVNKVAEWVDLPKGIFRIALDPTETDITPNNYVHQFVLTDGVDQHVIVYGDFVVLERLPE